MDESTLPKADYGNWVSRKLIYVPGVLGLLLVGLAFWLPVLGVVAIPFLLGALYCAYARRAFSREERNIPATVLGLLLERLDWDGKGQALDIGCGSGALAIAVAKRYPQARVTGVDYWDEAWEYSQSVCRRNAEIEGVAGRVTFWRASAAALPFAAETFDLAVSNLVFHEVRDVSDKRDAIKEALRVVKKGGTFAFQDLFLWKRVYGDIDDLLETIRSWGVERVEFANTSEAECIPKVLKLPFMIGTIGVLYGKK